jgi:hypothetical protein
MMKTTVHTTFVHGYAIQAAISLFLLTPALTLVGCFPPPMTDGGDFGESTAGETSTDTETGDGDGDGDPGDGDGDPELALCEEATHIEFSEVTCTDSGCMGRWQTTDTWSVAVPAVNLLGLPEIDPASVWSCQPEPVVDGCFQIDAGGHVACGWIMNGWAVPVAPCCAVAGFGWLPIGDGMAVAD